MTFLVSKTRLNYVRLGVSIRWTGPLDWTNGLDYWTHFVQYACATHASLITYGGLLPQLTDRIKQQVSQAIKTALAATSMAGQTGGKCKGKEKRQRPAGWAAAKLGACKLYLQEWGEGGYAWRNILCKSQQKRYQVLASIC